MLRTILGTSLILSATAGAFGQSTAARPAFEVSSVRVSEIGRAGGEGSRREDIQFTPDSVTMRNVSLKSAIQWGYHVMEYQVSGPEWLSTERYDIVAKSAGPVTEKELRLMAQALLTERFKVELHRQTKEFAAYALLVGKGGPKFKESQSEGKTNIQPDQKRMMVAVERAPMSQLVEMLSRAYRAPVVDMTGLTGKYDITIDFGKYLADVQPNPGGAPPDILSLIAKGLQDEMGLRLESRKVPLDLLIIDHAEKVPLEN
jgi:uncharacterized protein (TIGR03435 family)